MTTYQNISICICFVCILPSGRATRTPTAREAQAPRSQTSKLSKIQKTNSSHDNIPKHKHMHMFCVHPALRPGNAHPYRTRSPSPTQQNCSKTKNGKSRVPPNRVIRIVASKPYCPRKRCQMTIPTAQLQNTQRVPGQVEIR